MAGDATANGIGRSRNQGKLDSYVAILFVFGGFFVLAKLIAKQINSLNFQWLTRATRIHNPLVIQFNLVIGLAAMTWICLIAVYAMTRSRMAPKFLFLNPVLQPNEAVQCCTLVIILRSSAV